MPSEKDKVKGIEILALLRNLKKEFGEQGFATVLNQLPEQEREILAGTISPTKWYETEHHFHLMSAIHTVFGGPDYRVIQEFGRKNAAAMFNGVFRIFLSFISPQALLRNAAKFRRQVNSTGTLVVIESREGYARGRIIDFLVPGKIYCIFTAAYFERFFELCGAKNVKVTETKCFCRGDEYCEYEITWA